MIEGHGLCFDDSAWASASPEDRLALLEGTLFALSEDDLGAVGDDVELDMLVEEQKDAYVASQRDQIVEQAAGKTTATVYALHLWRSKKRPSCLSCWSAVILWFQRSYGSV